MNDPILSIGQAGLETTDEKVKSLMNRMVNAETPGFKGSEVVIRSFPQELQSAEKKYQAEEPRVEKTFYNHAKGPLIKTGGLTDFALGNDGFFVVLCPFGEGYTRDGRFTIDEEGKLVSTVGKYPMLGQNGIIRVPLNQPFEMSQSGEIKAGNNPIDRIRVVNFDLLNSLESVNGVIFKNPENKLQAKEIDSPRVIQGYVEASNVNVVDQMVDLIYLNRIYNLDTTIIRSRDGNLSRAIEMGKSQ
ncbi:MAG: flagellar basal-body rod protein FlgG [Candidatus Saganbacteria bacterium]|uniref:Flagellar basal-body rod protein FlgG n=1 Tax=Candidatus Saganbacteria bacterium TaxID=2575572 RepID=A0A833L067_UNCSA|nr:MAG: flagellar basal-body rod protein FlgG [Candidatus Saganbacteria bacterium]